VSTQPMPEVFGNPDPQPIIDTAIGFMRAKHLFVAAELGIFEALTDGPKSLDELARNLNLPARTARISVDAVTALGFLNREGDTYRNAPVAQAFLAGRGPLDFRPFIRFWNRISFRRWQGLEESVRLGRGVAGEFSFTPAEQKIFSEGVEGFTNSQAIALVDAYDFRTHHHVLDLGGGTGSFLRRILERYPKVKGTLYELSGAAGVASQKLSGTALQSRLRIIEGDFLKDAIPKDHDIFLVANVVHVLDREQNRQLFRRVRESAPRGARFLLVDFWTNAAHTEPLFAALMAGEFLVVGGNGDVYSVEEARSWLEQAGWRFLEHRPLTGPASLVIAEAAGE
jgi:SAM-dependent methyltransferase